MNKFKYYFILLLAGIAIVSCNKSDDDDAVTVPLRDYKEQYKADNDSIVKYLKSNYMTVIHAPGTPQDLDVVIKKIVPGDGNVSIWDQTEYPLKTRPVYSNDVNYEVYFLSLREGTGSKPMNTDKIVASYSGNLLNGTVFDSSYGSAGTFNLFAYSPEGSVIEGWSEIFPQFRTGTSTTNAETGVITYDNYGAGVMFIPSGLAYYASGKGTIPAYTSIVFSFKLFDLQRMDNEYTISSSTGGIVILGDGVPDYLEDVNGDGYVYDFRNTTKYPKPPKELIDDTDGDGVADFVDFDDDGDGFTTRFELTKPTNEIGFGTLNGQPFNYGARLYYPWDPTADNPNTPNVNEFEPRGIPRKPTGVNGTFTEEDYTAQGRLRIHLDKTYPIKKN
ncbi:hypothetical protein FLA105534_02601 [Flavobacterium bizetiae]|uniref:peptidylprolyl isomerase n=1 Tax=Flavobacterium bizetiae TaxID=2704140 RepID=A0A6J4GMU8_9FLAO|nr:FKBP-type peptidyl-prolyl cis-trans isomerase [Flavobacterium bizetiae]CAA9199408.1 hypothetical protein FLA105534_02601 [Flavobacterium bizetiae]CAD5342686.1 hypothetical protein FLA105535_02675 [Flavobacterium bizetiae]CAD5348932.1 hypothetical protein FLA105534_02905 [Flavobacterium bizetiae]